MRAVIPTGAIQGDLPGDERRNILAAFKTRTWLTQPATEKQLQYLSPAARSDSGLTRDKASALMTFGVNKRAIRQLILSAARSASSAHPAPAATAGSIPTVPAANAQTAGSARCPARRPSPTKRNED
ncbi:MAG: hypothetical protein U5K36_09275 [Roseovarius sp.]|nr:hypothetical protein [Roseovarius sp.]